MSVLVTSAFTGAETRAKEPASAPDSVMPSTSKVVPGMLLPTLNVASSGAAPSATLPMENTPGRSTQLMNQLKGLFN